MASRTQWQLVDFAVARDRWIDQEQPSVDVQFLVGEWILTRFDDPFQGMLREQGFPNLWYGAVPGTEFDGRAVVCSYFVEVRESRVRCDSFATLGLPI